MGYDMINSLANPIQCEDNSVRFDSCPNVYYPNKNNTQSITFLDETSILVEYNGVIP